MVMAGFYLAAEWRGERQDRRRELARIAGVFAAAHHDPSHTADALDLPDWVAELIAHGGVAVTLRDAAGTSLFASDPTIATHLGPSPGDAESSETIVAGRPALWLRTARADGAAVWIAVVGPSEDARFPGWLRDEIVGELGPMLAVFLIASLSVSWLSVRRDLRPVDRLSAAAAALRPGEDGGRLDETDAPREIAPLVLAMNQALTRADDAVARQRRLVADAAHELRTPLAVLQARLDGGVADPDGLRRDLAGLSRLVGQLLAKARAEAAPLLDAVDLAQLARACLSDVAPAALAAGRELELLIADPPPALIRADPDGMAAALRNLLENAVAFTPVGETVTLEVTSDGALWVLDRGPGLPTDSAERLFEPFWRAPGQARPGAGLGLAIARDAAARAGYRATAQNRPDGGAAFGLVPLGAGE